MNLTTAEPALAAWVSSLTGITSALCVWQNAPRPRFDRGIATLSWVSSTPRGMAGVDYDYVEATGEDPDPLTEMVPTQRGESVEVLQIEVLSIDQRPGYNASYLARRIVERCRMPSSVAALRAQNLGLQDVSSYRLADRKVDDRYASVAIVEVRLNATSAFTSTAAGDTTSFIDAVDYAGTVPGSDGNPLPTTIAPGGTVP